MDAKPNPGLTPAEKLKIISEAYIKRGKAMVDLGKAIVSEKSSVPKMIELAEAAGVQMQFGLQPDPNWAPMGPAQPAEPPTLAGTPDPGNPVTEQGVAATSDEYRDYVWKRCICHVSMTDMPREYVLNLTDHEVGELSAYEATLREHYSSEIGSTQAGIPVMYAAAFNTAAMRAAAIEKAPNFLPPEWVAGYTVDH